MFPGQIEGGLRTQLADRARLVELGTWR